MNHDLLFGPKVRTLKLVAMVFSFFPLNIMKKKKKVPRIFFARLSDINVRTHINTPQRQMVSLSIATV